MTKNELLFLFFFSILAGVFDSLGGWSKGNRMFRIVGVPLAMLGTMAALHFFNLKALPTLFLSCGLSVGAISTYRYFLPKPSNYQWWHYFMHGFFVSLAFLPWAIQTHHLMALGLRCFVSGFGVGIWSLLIGFDRVEEAGRGVIMNASLILFKIF